MNKKGFTLVEVIVSIVLVSIVMVSLLASLVKVKEAYTLVYENSDSLVYSSTISRIINNDLYKNGGIKYINCDTSGSICDLILGNNNKRRIEIYNVELGKNQTGIDVVNRNEDLKKEDNIYCESIPKNCSVSNSTSAVECECGIKLLSNTLKYTDTTSDIEKVIYMKTLKLKKMTDFEKNKISTLGYNFGRIYYNSTSFDSANKKVKTTNEPYKVALTSVTIEIFDGIDLNDSTYNIALHSSSTYAPNSIKTGDKITLTLYNDTLPNINSYISEYSELIIKYGIGFYVNQKTLESDGSYSTKLIKIDKLPSLPSIEGSTYKFNGYYIEKTEINEETGLEETTKKYIIDENGKILIKNNYFNSLTDISILKADWVE